MNQGNTAGQTARSQPTGRAGYPRRAALEPVPVARPMVVALTLSFGVLTVIVAAVFAFLHRSPGGSAGTPEQIAVADGAETMEAGGVSVPLAASPELLAVAREPSSASQTVEEEWGIQITSMRVGFGGNGLDLRYKVIDPAKATNLLHLREITYVIDQESGKALPLPFQKENQTAQKLVAGKTYFALLSNKGQIVKPGRKVTVAIGNSRMQDVIVE